MAPEVLNACECKQRAGDDVDHGAASGSADHRVELRTDRLILRRWRASDREPFARMNADPEVMRFYLAPYSREESDAMVDMTERQFEDRGYGLWAVEIPGEADFIGYVGLWAHPYFPAPEVGWRLDKAYWHKGYATEAARAAIADGFDRMGLTEVVSFTTPLNLPSIRVMQRLGMTHDAAGDFDHPNVPEGHPLRRHVLYRLSSNTGRFTAGPPGSPTISRAPTTDKTRRPSGRQRT